jgi:hypothetical protein
MAVDIPAIREVVDRVCTRKDVLDSCKRRDLGAVITVLCAHGITQGQLSALTGIPQGRLSEYKTRKRMPTATSTFEAFADGLRMPAFGSLYCASSLCSSYHRAISPAALRLRSAVSIAQSRFGPARYPGLTGVVRTVIRDTLFGLSLSGMMT